MWWTTLNWRQSMTGPSAHCVSSKTYCPRFGGWVGANLREPQDWQDCSVWVKYGAYQVRADEQEKVEKERQKKKKNRKKKTSPHHTFTQSSSLSPNPIRQVESLGQPNLSYGNWFPQTLSRLTPFYDQTWHPEDRFRPMKVYTCFLDREHA